MNHTHKQTNKQTNETSITPSFTPPQVATERGEKEGWQEIAPIPHPPNTPKKARYANYQKLNR